MQLLKRVLSYVRINSVQMAPSLGTLYLCSVQLFLFGSSTFLTQNSMNILAPFVKTYVNESFSQQYNHSLSDSELSWIFGSLLTGSEVGSFTALLFLSWSLHKFGRRNTWIFGKNLFILASCLAHIGTQYFYCWELLLIGRVLLGIAISLNRASNIYAGESVPNNIRGAAILVGNCAITFWALSRTILALPFIFGNDRHWQYVFWIPIPPALLQMLLCFTLPKSPKYLYITKKDKNAAVKAIEFFHGESSETDNILEHFDMECQQTNSTDSVALKQLLTEAHLRKRFILCLLAVLTPVLTGRFLLNIYSNVFLQKLGLDQFQAMLFLIGNGTMLLIASVGSIFVVEKIGRRCMAISMAFTGIILQALACFVSVFDIASKIWMYVSLGAVYFCFQLFALFGSGQFASILYSELMPHAARGKVTQICSLALCIARAPASFVFAALFDLIQGYLFLAFAPPTLFILFFMWKYLPETKNRHVDEIHLTEEEEE